MADLKREMARVARLRSRPDFACIEMLADELAEQADRDLSFLGLLHLALENTGLTVCPPNHPTGG